MSTFQDLGVFGHRSTNTQLREHARNSFGLLAYSEQKTSKS